MLRIHHGLLIGCLCAPALLVASCRAYDAALLENTKRTTKDAGARPSSEADAACIESEERCNRLDDDCDGKTDEETAATCERVVLNADTDCVALGKSASCVLLACRAGFEDCDGNPANGCEPYCACHTCPDAAADAPVARELDAGDDVAEPPDDGGGVGDAG